MVHTHQGYAHYARERVRVQDHLCARAGFASTAVYFERLAQKEARDEDRRCRLLEVARFYSSLAQIIPVMPNGYKNNKDGGLAATGAQRWRGRAEEGGGLAACFTDRTGHGQLTRRATHH